MIGTEIGTGTETAIVTAGSAMTAMNDATSIRTTGAGMAITGGMTTGVTATTASTTNAIATVTTTEIAVNNERS